ncbi:WD40 repeat-like protein [Suillus brevipes Sb2]|nr:WD40 repeat-like protein [Suillus brevipes Sb2]
MKGDKQLPGSHQKPVKTFEGHKENIICIATFPDGKRIATASEDKTIRIWRLEDGAEMMKWVVKQYVWALALAENGKQVVSSEGEFPDGFEEDEYDADDVLDWQLWVRDVESGSVVAGPLEGHTNFVITLDISPDGEMLASGSTDRTIILWDTSTWQRKGQPILCGSPIFCIRFSPAGQLGMATAEDIQIWDLDRRERLAQFKGHRDRFNQAANSELTWTRDGAHIFSAGYEDDPVIRLWDTSTWKQAGDPWFGHDKDCAINYITLNQTGTLLASASADCSVRLWRFHTGTEVAQFKHSDPVIRVAFSVDGRSIFSGGDDEKISQWEIPEDVLAAAESDSLASEKNKAAARGKHHMKRLLNSEIPGQRQNKPLNYQRTIYSTPPFAFTDSPLSPRSLDLRTFFDGIRPSSDKKGKRKEHRSKRNAPQVVDVPLGIATPGDAVGEDDGVRPYVLFFCLSWFQKKKKKPDQPPVVYDDEFDDDEPEHAVVGAPIPVPRTQPDTRKEMKSSPNTFFQPQPEAGPSRLAPSVDNGQEVTRIIEHEELELKPIASQTQPEARPSRLAGLEAHAGEEPS